jgi:hypothetical protein
MKLLIYTILYNEGSHIGEMLESLCTQTDTDFAFLVSDNYSTDDTRKIVDKKTRDLSRVSVIKPPQHLSGIEHGHFAYTHICENYKEFTHVMFLGGHDVLSQSFVSHLKTMATANPTSALVYTDTVRLSRSGESGERYPNSLNTIGVSRELIPFVVLLGLGHNIMSSGIWRMDVFQASKPRFTCCAADHLLLCEAAIMGAVTYAPGGTLYLRDAPNYRPGWEYYVEKHIPNEQRQKGCVYDFALQVAWLLSILERCAGVSVDQPGLGLVHSNYFLSGIQLYLLRYGAASQGFHDGPELFKSEFYRAVLTNDLPAVLGQLWRTLR